MTAEQKEIRDQDLADAVHEAMRQLVRVAKERGLKVTLSTPPRPPGTKDYPQINIAIRREF